MFAVDSRLRRARAIRHAVVYEVMMGAFEK